MRLSVIPALVIFFPLMAQTPIGAYDGRWLCVTATEGKKDGLIDFFIDPTTIKFDRELSAWIVWERTVKVASKEVTITKTAYRKEGEETAFLSQVVYDPDGNPSPSFKSNPLDWNLIIPGSCGDILWNAVAKIRDLPAPAKK